MTPKIDKAFILAAGEGRRMRPLTETCPKPLLEVAGKPIIDYALDDLKAAGIRDVVVNLCYRGDQLAQHLETKTDFNITLSWEEERLETGGGVKKALDHFGDQPFMVLNGDVIWNGGQIPALDRLLSGWDAEAMDALLLLQPIEKLTDFDSVGDYILDPATNRLTRRRDAPQAPYVFAGPRIIHPRLFDNSPEGGFGFLELFDQAEDKARLYGAVHDGNWYHIGTPEALKDADRILRQQRAA
ncbi:MAG: nucleotidyltransferase family protein [Pseudomonadota bacterium]